MLHFLFHHWIIFAIVGVASAVVGWIFWELNHAPIDPRDSSPRPYEEGTMREIHNTQK